MNRRQVHRWVSWVLPLIVARTLVPGGFMLSAGEHGIEIVVCSGSGPVPSFKRADYDSSSEHNGHHADHTQQQSGGGSDDSPDAGLCLFVAGAVVATVAWALPAIPEHGQNTDFASEAVGSAEPFLPDRIRGPPLA